MSPKPIAAVTCVVIFSVAASLCYGLLTDELIFLRRGVSTEGVVLGKTQESSRRSESSSSSYHVQYKFEVNGRTLQNKNMLDLGRGYDSIKQGDTIGIVYDPQNPQLSRAHMAAPWARYPLILVFIVAMSGTLAFKPIQILRRRKPTVRVIPDVPDRFGSHLYN